MQNKLKIEETIEGGYVITAENEDGIVADIQEAISEVPETLKRVKKMVELYNDWAESN